MPAKCKTVTTATNSKTDCLLVAYLLDGLLQQSLHYITDRSGSHCCKSGTYNSQYVLVSVLLYSAAVGDHLGGEGRAWER